MEKLYNNIILEDGFRNTPSNANNVPYLKNPPEVIDITVGRQLFVDDFLIEETSLSSEYHQAKKYENNPVLAPDMPWERETLPAAAPRDGGLWYDEEEKVFKIWYEGSLLKNMCYATSKDGINFDKKDLGIVKGTNIILPYDGYDEKIYFRDINYLRPDTTSIFFDPNDPVYKYKLCLKNPNNNKPAIVAKSKDGITFEDFHFTGQVAGDATTMFYNPFRKKWVYSLRSYKKMEELAKGTNLTYHLGSERVRSYRECDDLIEGATWEDDDAKLWMHVDEFDKPNPYLNVKPQLYKVNCIAYESIMLGFFQIHYGPENDECVKKGIPKITALIPMYSRDGYHFSRPNRDPLITSSFVKGSWDRGYVQSICGGLVICGDELRIYYTGCEGDETNTKQGSLEAMLSNGMYHNISTGFATLRRDGFVSMNGNGELLTRKLTLSNKNSLFVNVNGSIKAQILDETGNVIATSNLFNGDSTNAQLTFESFDVSSLNGKVFRIKFLVDGKFYAFGFADENGDFNGAHGAGIVK